MRRPLERLKTSVYVENLWLHILRLLSKKSYTGYVIRGEINKKFGFWVGNVTSYKVLYMLEKGGYVRSEKHGREIYYIITPKGKEELEAGEKFLDAV
ncbi:MAG: PadR family transcriptional regulator [Candidatus Aenigmarchaeota archaeon]|nr:PadR family transcriptional regulator [Candidatus Aenigmarchaeota archaeon]